MTGIKQINLNDIRHYSSYEVPGTDGNLFFIDKFHEIDFKEKSLQLGFMFFVYCKQGTVEITINDTSYNVKPGDLIVGLNELTIAETKPSEDFMGRIIIASQNYCRESFVGMQNLWPNLLYLYNNPIIHLTEKEQSRLADTLTLFLERMSDVNYTYHTEAALALLRLFYFDVCNMLQVRVGKPDEASMRSYDIFNKFLHLVQENCCRERSVQWYSEQLCLSAKYFSEVVKSVSGRTAGQWITNMVVLEIKALLLNPELSVKEVAQKLNFPNQSFMGKYFKNATGISPSEYRNS
ncbi:AraC family transcriptional regulator [Alloprevotella rava]|uniref:AraC-like DNA-binding protein n=1 Tax=Alloprevotella rava TaxID=671218 RepID=A0A7W5XXG0_9BACT|nr:helix-turn-helix transcriptional regulator [Alloprevotella rava]MBB3702323.1 AraC-like DNA-binding protein [Alloprevotella rava]